MSLPAPGARTAQHCATPPSLLPHTAALALLLATPWALAQSAAAAADDTPVMAAVAIKGEAVQAGQAAFSVTGLHQEEIRQAAVGEVEALWRQVPGMHVNRYQLSGVANSVVLRGFSGGGHGGDVGAVLDGIPLNEAMSHADGYFDLNVVVPLELEKVDIYRGPVSPLYGNYNRAGLIALQTRRGGEYREVDASLDSHGGLDLQTALGLQLSGDDHLSLAAQHARGDGFRTQSDYRRSTLSARWQHRVDSRLDIAVAGRIHEATGDSPGYLTQAQFNRDPDGKDPRAQNDGADKHFKTLRVDATYRLDDSMKLLGFAYGTQQDFVRWFSRPVGGGLWRQREENYDRQVWGAGLNLSGQQHWAGQAVEWMAGVETVRERTDYQFWDALDQRRRTQAAANDRRAALDNVAAYGQLHWKLHPLFQPTAAVRWDRFTGDCTRLGAETSTETNDGACGRMASLSHTSPKLGVIAQPVQDLTLRASWSEGFALPSDFAKYALGAAAVAPNVFRQTELGAKWQVVRDWMVDAAVYQLKSSHEIRSVGLGVYENYGATERKGLEIHSLWAPSSAWQLQWAYGRVLSKVTENGNAALVGRQVAGVPAYTSTLSVQWQPVAAWQAQLSWRKLGRAWVNAANTEVAEGYATWDLGLRHTLEGGSALAGHTVVYAQLRNLTDRRYPSTVAMIGGERLVAPGEPRTLQVGLQLSF